MSEGDWGRSVFEHPELAEARAEAEDWKQETLKARAEIERLKGELKRHWSAMRAALDALCEKVK